MKKLLFLFPLLLVLSLARAQTITNTSAVPHTTGTPSGAPSTYGSWLRYDKTNKILYRWTGSAWTASLPGAVADGDKGSITVSGSGGTWSVDVGEGGIYEGSGTVPASTTATLAPSGTFKINTGTTSQFRVGDTEGAGTECQLLIDNTQVELGTGTYGFYVATGSSVSANAPSAVISLGTTASSITVQPAASSFTVVDNRATKVGIQYGGDYSGASTDRTLIDKAHAMAINATNANLTGPVTSVGNATTITANAIDSSHIANGTISPNDFAQRGASVGQVMKYTANGWRAGAALSDGDKGDITVSGSGATWDIDASAVGSSEIAANAIDSTKVAASSLSPSDIGPSGASVGQVMAYTSNGWRPRGGRATLGSNVTTTSGSLVDATGLSFSVESGATYYFRATILHQSTSTAIGVALAHNGPALTSLATMVIHPTSNTAFQQVQQTAYDTNIALSTSMSAANTNYVSISEGYITCSASGTFIIRFRAEVAGTQVQISANSFIDYLKL